MADFLSDTVGSYSNSFGSLLKVPSTTKTQASAVQNAAPGDITVSRDAFLSSAYGSIITPPVQKQAADFYRSGQLNTDGSSYNYLPRFVEAQDQDEPASIRLLGKNPINAPGEDTDLIPPYSKFFLERVQEPHSERSQVVETFGDFYVFFFGERPPIYTFSGTLLNSNSINWAQDFRFYYDNFLRGTKCVELGAKLLLTYGFSQVEGFILNTSMGVTAAIDNGVSVDFQVLVIDRKVLKLSLDFGLISVNGQFNPDKSFLDLLQHGLSDPNSSTAAVTVQKVSSNKQPPTLGVKTDLSDLTDLSKAFPNVAMVPSSTGALKAVL